MSLAHSSHIGLGGCLRRLCECMFWPGMSSQMKYFVSQCDVCLTHRDSQVREPILQHDVSLRPWEKVGANLCYFSGRVLLVVSDYFSNFIEVDSVSAKNSKAVIRSLMATFNRNGVPDSVVTDNGKAENAVRTVKRLFTKCRAAGVTESQALLDWRNNPGEGLDASPAQRFFGRRCKTLLPTTEALLRPRFSLATDAKSYAPRWRSRRNSTIMASALLLHSNLVKWFVFVPRDVPGNEVYV